MNNVQNQVEELISSFTKTYNQQPSWIVSAPGRVNIIGEHTDYNGGFVLPMAINKRVYIAAAPYNDVNSCDQVNLSSTAKGFAPAVFSLSEKFEKLPHTHNSWLNYPLGVISLFKNIINNQNIKLQGFNALVHSTVPLGSGVSSSAALEVATATLLESITNYTLEPIAKALLCQSAEHQYAGMPCGIMDQYISVLGKTDNLLLIDCKNNHPEYVPMSDDVLGFLIINSNVKHKLVDGEYAKRRAQCEMANKILGINLLRDVDLPTLENKKNQFDELIYRRAYHVVSENERTLKARLAIINKDWQTLGELMYKSHTSMRDDFEITCPELDYIVEIAKTIGIAGGVYGCRMTGGGFGGCAVALINKNNIDTISATINEKYQKQFNLTATIFYSSPSFGAFVHKI